MGGYATILGGDGDDFINPVYANDFSIDGGAGNDTIITNGKNSTVDGGAGNNLIRLTDEKEGAQGKFIIFDGSTTVEGFNMDSAKALTQFISITTLPPVNFCPAVLRLTITTATTITANSHLQELMIRRN